MRNPYNEVQNSNESIDRDLSEAVQSNRDIVSQRILQNMRHLVEHVAMYGKYGNKDIDGDYYSKIRNAINSMKGNHATADIVRFHESLQKTISHYTPSRDDSERLLLWYYDSLLDLKRYAASLGLHILKNLNNFPLFCDAGMQPYYVKIAEAINDVDSLATSVPNSLKEEACIQSGKRFYLLSRKPFVVNNQIYYEYAASPCVDRVTKGEHIVLFSSEKIQTNYAVELRITNRRFLVDGVSMEAKVIYSWKISIRPSEIKHLSHILGDPITVKASDKQYKCFMRALMETGYLLNEIATLSDAQYLSLINVYFGTSQGTIVESLLDASRKHILANNAGSNVLRYLLFRPRNGVIKDQLQEIPNRNLGGLFLRNACIPFDNLPYSFSLKGHNVKVLDVFQCIQVDGHEDELLGKCVSNNARKNLSLYTPEDELLRFGDIDSLINKYNSKLYIGHDDSRLLHEMGNVVIKKDEKNVAKIIHAINSYAQKGIKGYEKAFDQWYSANSSEVDDEEKVNVLRTMFERSKVFLVYGSAGTGKTTLVRHLVRFLSKQTFMLIANTNSAVDNMKRKIAERNCEYRTVASYLSGEYISDFLIVDECSTVSNADMLNILEGRRFKALLLVGDVRQIEAIDLGNWFKLVKEFVDPRVVAEFNNTYRTTNSALLNLWKSVRNANDRTAELLSVNNFTHPLDSSFLSHSCSDEIVLSLNYDGIYGINNINRVLQSQNDGKSIHWGLNDYIVGDPILFNDSGRFHPLLYNNLKGVIEDIEIVDDFRVRFSISVDLPIIELDVACYPGLSLIGHTAEGNAIVGFEVASKIDSEEADAGENLLPFIVSYAISIHKAQGLEFDSVKLIVSKDVEDGITPNIFYTAISRAKKNLSIYWSPETQDKIIKNLETPKRNRDVSILRARFGDYLYS